MKKWLVSLAFLVTHAAWAQNSWLLIAGDANDPAVDTVEVDPASLAGQGNMRSMRMRVSRAVERTSTDGVPFRSFIAEITIDCAAQKARFQWAEFFALPSWQGDSHGRTTYSPSEVRPVALRDLKPNPTLRIIRAACQTGSVQTSRP